MLFRSRVAKCADDLCVARSLVGVQPLHGQQALLLHTGRVTGRAPSLGSWASYGLGTENRSLPGYVLLNNDWIPNGGYENFSSAFLPATHAATLLRAKGVPVDNIIPSDQVAIQRRKLMLLKSQDSQFANNSGEEQLIESVIQNYETAFRMQTNIPQVADVNQETKSTHHLYGLDSSMATERIAREIGAFELEAFVDDLTESYSHGMRQRTVFAAALIHLPEVLVVDEPMVGLDPHSIRLVKDLMREYVDAGKTVLMSTHMLNVAEEIADRVAVLKSGNLLFEGEVSELRSSVPDTGASLESLYLSLMDQ